MSELSRDEIIKYTKNFLLNSPPGEFMEVVQDVRTLLQDDVLINEIAPTTFREYNTDQMLNVQSPAGSHQFLITKFGELSPNEYLDPRGKTAVTFDHIEQKVKGSKPYEMDSEVEPFRASLDEALTKYIEDHFQYGVVTVYGSKSGPTYTLHACISSAKFNPGNFWNGRWRSVWKITFKANDVANLEGALRCSVHYYDDGNVQLNTKFSPKVQTNVGNPSQTASEIAKAIKKAEQDYQTALETTYNTMGDTTFKALRRVLPITKNRLDWERIKNEKMKN
jgi:capping protein alpha